MKVDLGRETLPGLIHKHLHIATKEKSYVCLDTLKILEMMCVLCVRWDRGIKSDQESDI